MTLCINAMVSGCCYKKKDEKMSKVQEQDESDAL
jgi:hypothetical protein